MMPVVEMPDRMWLLVVEFLDLSSILMWVKTLRQLVLETGRKKSQYCNQLKAFGNVLELVKVVHLTDLSFLDESWIFPFFQNVQEIHFYSLMKNLNSIPSTGHYPYRDSGNNGGIITPGYAASFIVQFLCQIPSCKLVAFWNSRNAMEKNCLAVNHVYVGALMDELSWAYHGKKLSSAVSVLGLKCPLSSVTSDKRYRHDDPGASRNCKHCKMACKFWPIDEVLKFRSTYSIDGRYDRRGMYQISDEPFASVSPEPSYTDVCQDIEDIERALRKRDSAGIRLDPKTRLMNIMKGSTVHKFRPRVFPGQVLCFVTLNCTQICWMTEILEETHFEIKQLSGYDIKQALMGPSHMHTHSHERWYVRSATLLQELFGVTLKEKYWPSHCMPVNKYTRLEAMTLSLMFNLRHHHPHLEADQDLIDFHHSWIQSPKGYRYEDMLGLGFCFKPRRRNGLLVKGRTFIMAQDSSGRKRMKVEEIKSNNGEEDGMEGPDKKVKIIIGKLKEGISMWTAYDFFPKEVTDLMEHNQRLVQLK
jgi:hypothetical protein